MSTRWRSPHHLVSRGRSLQGPTYAFPMLQPQKLCQFLWAYFWKTGLQTLFFETLCSDVHQKFSDFRKVIEYIYIRCCIHPWQDLGHTAHENVFIPRGINEEHTDMALSTAFHFITLPRYYVFTNLKVCGHPMSSKSVGIIVQQHLFTLCLCVTFWKFLPSFKFFHHCYVCYGDLWSVSFDVTFIILLVCHRVVKLNQ